MNVRVSVLKHFDQENASNDEHERSICDSVLYTVVMESGNVVIITKAYNIVTKSSHRIESLRWRDRYGRMHS